MECTEDKQPEADTLVSPWKKLKLGSEDTGTAVKRRESAGRRNDLSKNRLSQRASILCMCQCDSNDCLTKTVDLEQNTGQCELHKQVNDKEGIDEMLKLNELMTCKDGLQRNLNGQKNLDPAWDQGTEIDVMKDADRNSLEKVEIGLNDLSKEELVLNGNENDIADGRGTEVNATFDRITNIDDCAPDVYGSEGLASMSASCSLNSINIACDETEQTVVVENCTHDEDAYTCGLENNSNQLETSIGDETIKCNDNDLDVSDSDDSEIEIDHGEISVDEVDFGEDDDEASHIKVNQNTETPPERLKNTVSMSGPLCASTPLGKYIPNKNKPSDLTRGDMSDYPTMTTFKPLSDTVLRPYSEEIEISDATDSIPRPNSMPLCSSTPVIKQVSGLKMRDANIKDQDDEKFGKRNIIDDILCLESCLDDEGMISKFRTADGKENENINERVNETEKLNEKAINTKGKDKAKKKEVRKDRKKMKGTRVEKFKEYLGPGLTCNPNDENELNKDKPRDILKNTDIETCTLTEYKGFGLTGPLPDKPLHASTPAPPKGLSMRDPNIRQTISDLHQKQSSQILGSLLPKSVSYKDIINRPAGTEGFIMTSDGQFPSLKRTNSVKVTQKIPQSQTSLQKSKSLNTVTNKKTSRLTTVTSHASLDPALLQPPLDSLSGSSGQMTSGTSSALQPDDVYPSMSSVPSDKSDNCSTDRSDRSSKSGKPFEASVLQSFGQLKVSAYMNFGLLTVHVVQGRQLSTKWKSSCDSFVKMCLIPDDGKKPKCKTAVVQDSNNPLYDEKFSFELNDEDHCKRLMISVWHRDQNASVNEFLGCMSFGVRHLTNPKKEVSGWYYLLTEDIGRKKHLKVTHRQVPQLKVRHHANIPAVNKDVWGTETHHLTLHRGKNGYGFSVIEACPVRVGRVDGSSPAESAGLQPGDIIIRLNKQNVSRSTATSVAKLVKNSSSTLFLEIHRQKPVTFEHLDHPHHGNNDFVYEMNENDYSVPDMNTINDEDKENQIGLQDETVYGIPHNIASLATSTPLPLLAKGHRTVQTSEMRKQEAIHQLLSLELDFIDLMHAGMQRYSRPLRHCILSHSQHTALFQNIEKLTTISEYHVKQMHDNAPSSFVSEDTDTSVTSDNHNFLQSIGLIYQSKVHMLCQAYDLYAKGVSRANQVLSDLQHNEDFMKFIHDPPLEMNQPDIKLFTYQPVKHIRDLYRVIQDIFLNTSQDSSDYNSLKQVVEGLQECATCITNYSCERIESMSSLNSRESKTSSFTSSMKSRSSTCSSRSSSSKGHSSGPSCSLQTSKSIDTEVMKIQDKLVFSSNVPVFQLCQDDRHIVFSGDMYKWEGHQWVKVHMILFTDMILLTMKEADGYLRVLQEPTMLRDVTGMDAQRHHGTEIVLYCKPRVHSNRKLSLRAPSTEQKYAWKSLIEQRVFAVRGTLEYYSSTSDLSSSSASAIII